MARISNAGMVWHECTCSQLPWSGSKLPTLEGETRPKIHMAQFRRRFENSEVAVIGDATAEVLHLALLEQLCTSPNMILSVLAAARRQRRGRAVWFPDANMTLSWHDAPYLIPASETADGQGQSVFIDEQIKDSRMVFKPKHFSNVQLVLVAIGRGFSPRAVPGASLRFKSYQGNSRSHMVAPLETDSHIVRHCVQTVQHSYYMAPTSFKTAPLTSPK